MHLFKLLIALKIEIKVNGIKNGRYILIDMSRKQDNGTRVNLFQNIYLTL